jgi:hypothetical protein
MTRVIPRTPEIDCILAEIESVALYYGAKDVWLFPSRDAESGHMEEEKAVSLGLRKHSGIRFTRR